MDKEVIMTTENETMVNETVEEVVETEETVEEVTEEKKE